MNVQPYLFFNGQTEQALDFYKKAVGAKVSMLMHFRDAPDQSNCSADMKDLVMHTTFTIGDTEIFASDGMGKSKPNFDGFSLTVNVKDEAEAEKTFKALAEGGSIAQPLIETFFARRWGMLKDKFGVHWMVIASKPAN
jgi:PhnB protein